MKKIKAIDILDLGVLDDDSYKWNFNDIIMTTEDVIDKERCRLNDKHQIDVNVQSKEYKR
jgi:hypothetical protein